MSHAVKSRRMGVTLKSVLGPKSFEELILKTMVNSGYGKMLKTWLIKGAWDAYNQEMIELGDSALRPSALR